MAFEGTRDNFLVISTDSLAGYEINKYFNMISTRVVVGVGFLSEFFAGFTDAFGGRSRSLESRLTELYETAVDILVKDARKLGANALIGTRFDVDEISGKGTMMLMVSAVATPVSLTNLRSISPAPREDAPTSHRNLMIRFYASKVLEYNSDTSPRTFSNTLRDLTKENILLPYDALLHFFAACQGNLALVNESFGQDIDAYISVYDPAELSEQLNLYSVKHTPTSKEFLYIYENYARPDYSAMVKIFRTGDKRLWVKAFVKVLSTPKDYYTQTDIDSLTQLCKYLSDFINGSAMMTSSIMGGKSWRCQSCGKKNAEMVPFCSCGCGASGLLFEQEQSIKAAIDQATKICTAFNTINGK